jgi:hypothetical protein
MINDRPGRQNDGPYRFRIEESYFDGEPFIAFQKLTTLELFDRYSRLRTHIARHDLPPTSTPLHRLAWIEYEHDLLFRMIEGRDSRSRRVEDRANQITPVPVTRIEAGEGEEEPPERLKGLEDDTPEKRKKSEAKRKPRREKGTEHGKEAIGEQGGADKGKTMENNRKKSKAEREPRRPEKTEHGKSPLGEREDTDQGRTKKKKQDG